MGEEQARRTCFEAIYYCLENCIDCENLMSCRDQLYKEAIEAVED